MKRQAISRKCKDCPRNIRHEMHEDRWIYEVVALSRIFDIEPTQLTIGKTGNFKCPYCTRIRTSSLLVAAIHMATWHSDKMNLDIRMFERKDLKDIMDHLSGERKTIPERFRNRPPTRMVSII